MKDRVMKNIQAGRKKIIKKIVILGGLLILIPLTVLITLLTIAFIQLKGVHKQYDVVVQKLHTDIDDIDKSINRDTAIINQNQEKIGAINRQFGLTSLKHQMNYSAGEFLFRISGLKEYKHKFNRENLLSIYLDKSQLPKDLFVRTQNPKPGDITFVPPPSVPLKKIVQPLSKKTPTRVVHPSTSVKLPPKTLKSKNQNTVEQFKKDFSVFLKQTPVFKGKKFDSIIQNFISHAKLGYENRAVFLISHETLHSHTVIWSTEPYWRGRKLKKVKELKPISELMVSKDYMRAFLKFQKGKSLPQLLTKLIPLKGTKFIDAKYNFSKQEYFAIIPIFGTTFSLGLKTPLSTPEFQALDSISRNLGKAAQYFDETSVKINKVDESTMNLHKKFNSETDKFGHTFLIMLLLSFFFVVVTSVLEIIFIQKGMVKPIIHLTDVANRIRQGEFETRCQVDTEDELEDLAQSINAMLDRIVVLIGSDADRMKMQKDILALLESVSAASKGDLTGRGKVGTPELQAVNDAFNHMLTSIGSLVVKVRKSGMGLEITTRMLLESLRHILTKSTKQTVDLDIASRKIKALGDRSQEITRMVEQIGNIAMETRTLALNATLEASREGDRDSGIAHLAEHVRQLAEGLEKTKQDIESFIGSIQLATNYAVQSMEEVLGLTRTTRNEAERSYKTAEKTYIEAEELGKAIALFRVKTPKDQETEVELKGVMGGIVASVRNIRVLVNNMDTKEFDSLNVILDDFEKDLTVFGGKEQLLPILPTESFVNEEIPAIMETPGDE
jgi:methyl-accepting chemotaxis protein